MATKKKKKLIDFFGILSKEEGEAMLGELKKSREIDLKLTKERIKLLDNIKKQQQNLNNIKILKNFP